MIIRELISSICSRFLASGQLCTWEAHRGNCAVCLVCQLCPTLCDPMDCSLSGSSVHGILQARIFGLPFSSPEELPNPGIEPWSPASQADSPFELQGSLLYLLVNFHSFLHHSISFISSREASLSFSWKTLILIFFSTFTASYPYLQ